MRRGVPIYSERGALFAPSVEAAARTLGCNGRTVMRHAQPWRDGYQLVSRPAYAGKRGGGRYVTTANERAVIVQIRVPPEAKRLYASMDTAKRRAVRAALCELLWKVSDA